MNASVTLEWTFSPADYFEEPIKIRHDDYILMIDNGKVQARANYETYTANPSMRAALQDTLNSQFLGAQLVSNKEYKLSTTATIYTMHPDGRKQIATEIPCGHIMITGHPPDLNAVDKSGNVILNTQRDRIEKKKRFADLVSRYRGDYVLESLLRSHNTAVRDPNNELVHLYEIRDALSNRFGGESASRSTLGISSSDWSRFGLLCNNEPLKQGRHRGKHPDALRDATEAELSETRRISQSMIEAYLQHLDNFSDVGGS